jgi:hypothetical protein
MDGAVWFLVTVVGPIILGLVIRPYLATTLAGAREPPSQADLRGAGVIKRSDKQTVGVHLAPA